MATIDSFDVGIDNSKIKTIVDARMLVARKLEEIYDKRSAFDHPRGKNTDDLCIHDYYFVLKTLHLVVTKLIELKRQGITHIKKEGKLEDTKSLDSYLQQIKYS